MSRDTSIQYKTQYQFVLLLFGEELIFFSNNVHCEAKGLSINNVSVKGGGGVSQILTLANGKKIQQKERILMGKAS